MNRYGNAANVLGGMNNLSLDRRETDLRIRLDLGLPMVDDANDFLGACSAAVDDRDERIVELEKELADEQKEAAERDERIDDLEEELADEKEISRDRLNAMNERDEQIRLLNEAVARLGALAEGKPRPRQGKK